MTWCWHNRKMQLYNAMCCAPLELPAGGIEVAKDEVSSVRLGAPDVTRGAGVEADHRLLHLPISYAGARGGVWRQLMGLSHEDQKHLADSGVDMADLVRLVVESRLEHDLGDERAHVSACLVCPTCPRCKTAAV